MSIPRVGVATEFDLAEYRSALIDLLERQRWQLLDCNLTAGSQDSVDLVQYVTDLVNDAKLDLVVLVSRSGNGLQMLANKYPTISAAVLFNDASAVEAAVELRAQMCEISSVTHTPEMAAALIRQFVSSCGASLNPEGTKWT